MGQDLQADVEEKLGIPCACQRFLFGDSALELELARSLHEQGITCGSTITVVFQRPQATLLRIRKAYLGDNSSTRCQSLSRNTGAYKGASVWSQPPSRCGAAHRAVSFA